VAVPSPRFIPTNRFSWRAFDLAASLDAPRLFRLQVSAAAGKTAFLGCSQTVMQGEELCAVTRLGADDKMPESMMVRGYLAGQPFERELPVKDVAPKADYLPRTWATLEIERLLTEDAAKHKPRIVELSKAMYVMTPFTPRCWCWRTRPCTSSTRWTATARTSGQVFGPGDHRDRLRATARDAGRCAATRQERKTQRRAGLQDHRGASGGCSRSAASPGQRSSEDWAN